MRSLTVFGLGLLIACSVGCKKSAPKSTSTIDLADAAASNAFPNAPPAPDDVAAPPADAIKSPSGLASKVLTPGKEKDHPGPFDKMLVHYTGWTKAGKVFDSSAGGLPFEFGVNEVIKGWTEGIQLMTKGEKRRFWIPAALAYGDTPRGGAPAGDLVFDVELVDFKAGRTPPQTPSDVGATPPDAKRTASGLAYKVLSKGKGSKHAALTDKVTVNYAGWTPDGKMFDSSMTRGEPLSFGLKQVIKGWTEGIQLMVEGERTRFWIPSDLAYGDKPTRPGAPAGPLVFDIELVAIQ